jgi:hypothetical protein
MIPIVAFLLGFSGCAQKMSRNNPFDPQNISGGGGGGNDTYVKLLLHMDGSNGSSTFVDSSSYGRTINVVSAGQTPITSNTQAKFGSASLCIPGTGVNGNDGWLSIPASADFNPGSGDFTVDLWFYHTNTVDQGTLYGYSGTASGSQGTDHKGMALYVGFGGVGHEHSLRFSASSNNSTWDLVDATSLPNVLNANAWNHIAVVRYGNVWTLYVNGIQYYQFTSSASIGTGATTEAFNVGHWGAHALDSMGLGGYIDEFRFSKGIARWTSNFTPPTAPY